MRLMKVEVDERNASAVGELVASSDGENGSERSCGVSWHREVG